jgi:hypothetical protein
MSPLKAPPLLIDKLTPELGGKVVKIVADDMDRAKKAAEQKRKRKGAKKR